MGQLLFWNGWFWLGGQVAGMMTWQVDSYVTEYVERILGARVGVDIGAKQYSMRLLWT